MASSTHQITISKTAYTNVSNGNANCGLFLMNRQRVLCHIGGIEPAADTVDCFTAGGGADYEYDGRRLAFYAENLELETELWVRAESEDVVVAVVRGDVKLGIL